ncbi:hypothetical protein [Paractinoplanes atraurantiacus]|uniref:Uncharacterized protein n=1 Tax=Paractinoplanes atraurantiacus TaxID=1036182 RepID=A0A285IYU9_9ACTN|nr:hypothetical protein [Actinoplanes atraurantiacus]SNY52837.1 hypothetical protein SAMN05421748_113109 [Actinoplanes atraurantiacus]
MDLFGLTLVVAGVVAGLAGARKLRKRWARRREEGRFRRLIEAGWLPCPRCDGAGKISTPAGYLGAPVFHVCGPCGGEGMLPPL